MDFTRRSVNKMNPHARKLKGLTFLQSIIYGIFRAGAGNCDLQISHTTDTR